MLDAIPDPPPSHVRPILVGPARAVDSPPLPGSAASEPLVPTGRGSTRWLGDVPMGLDRRGGRRGATQAPADRFTAATHRPLPLVFGLRTGLAHALLKGLSFSPRGVLLHLLDILDPDLDAHERLGALGLLQLSRAVGTRASSPLGLLTACMEARAHVADLSRRATRATWPSSTVDLVVLLRLCPGGAEAIAPIHLRGVLATLADPRPAVLAVALAETALAQVEALLASPTKPSSERIAVAEPTRAAPPHELGVGSPPERPSRRPAGGKSRRHRASNGRRARR